MVAAPHLAPLASEYDAGCRTVVHVFADAATRPAQRRISMAVRAHETGWPSIVVLPPGSGWTGIATTCARAGARVVRDALLPRGDLATLRHAARMMGVLRERLAVWDTVLVHAHDDAAALVWGLAARARGVPLVWDADLDARAAPLDRIRFAVTSYLLLEGQGRRLRMGQRLPPYHRASSADGDAGALRAYEVLTGQRPAAVVHVPDAPSVAHNAVDART